MIWIVLAIVVAFLAGAACYGLVGYVTLVRCVRGPRDRSTT